MLQPISILLLSILLLCQAVYAVPPAGCEDEKPSPNTPAVSPRPPYPQPTGDGTHVLDTDPIDDLMDEWAEQDKRREFLDFDMKMQSIQAAIDELENPTQEQIDRIMQRLKPKGGGGWRAPVGFGARTAGGVLIDGFDEAAQVVQTIKDMGGPAAAAGYSAHCMGATLAAAGPYLAAAGAAGLVGGAQWLFRDQLDETRDAVQSTWDKDSRGRPKPPIWIADPYHLTPVWAPTP